MRYVLYDLAEFTEVFDSLDKETVFVSEDKAEATSIAQRLNAGEDIDAIMSV